MKLFKWGYGALALVAAIALIASFFIQDVTPITQITLLIQSVGFGWICGAAIGTDM
jgi:hypothetical protein